MIFATQCPVRSPFGSHAALATSRSRSRHRSVSHSICFLPPCPANTPRFSQSLDPRYAFSTMTLPVDATVGNQHLAQSAVRCLFFWKQKVASCQVRSGQRKPSALHPKRIGTSFIRADFSTRDRLSKKVKQARTRTHGGKVQRSRRTQKQH